jgi:hypothetical protein
MGEAGAPGARFALDGDPPAGYSPERWPRNLADSRSICDVGYPPLVRVCSKL